MPIDDDGFEVSEATLRKRRQLARANMAAGPHDPKRGSKIRQSAETLRTIHEQRLHDWKDVREMPGTRHVGDIEAKIQTVTQTASGVVNVTMVIPAAAIHRITDIKMAALAKHVFMRCYTVDPGDFTAERDPENFDEDQSDGDGEFDAA